MFANYSQNILPPNAGSQPYLSGARPAPEKGEGYDYGLRVSTGDGKYYATLSRYDSKSEGRNVENPVDVRGLWQKYNIARSVNADSGLGSAAYSDTTSLEVSGYEFERTANPLRNLRIQASYGLPGATVIDFYPLTRAHVAKNLAAWTTQAGSTANPTQAADLRNAIASVQDKLTQSVEGSPQQGSVDYTASIFATYTFDRERLKGWSIGAGAAFTGRSYQAIYDGVEYHGNSVRNIHGVLAYETTIGRAQARFALNVENISDEDEPIVTGYHWGYADSSGRHIRDGYYFQSPRTFRLSARFTFQALSPLKQGPPMTRIAASVQGGGRGVTAASGSCWRNRRTTASPPSSAQAGRRRDANATICRSRWPMSSARAMSSSASGAARRARHWRRHRSSQASKCCSSSPSGTCFIGMAPL